MGKSLKMRGNTRVNSPILTSQKGSSYQFIADSEGARESLLSSATQKTPKPVTAPKEDNVRRTGTKMSLAVETLFVGLLHNMQNYGAVPRPLDRWWRN